MHLIGSGLISLVGYSVLLLKTLYQELDFGVPQGSVLGPIIYCMYTKPVSDIIERHGLSHHSYADDTQLYMTMDHSNNDWRDGLARIELCVSEIREWINQNMLKLNDDKTELIVFASKYKQDLYNDLSITIGDTVVVCSSQVRDLGVIFDRVLSLRQHVSYTSRACRFRLRNISRIRKYIPQDISIVLIKSLVMSRLDYSNGLLYGLPKCTVSGLQAVQNSAARIVTQERLRDHKYGSRSFVRASANLWKSLRGERAAWGSNDSRLHVVEPPRGISFIWQIGVNTSIQDRRQVDRVFLWSRVSCTRQR